jgi:hypothetical protein
MGWAFCLVILRRVKKRSHHLQIFPMGMSINPTPIQGNPQGVEPATFNTYRFANTELQIAQSGMQDGD